MWARHVATAGITFETLCESQGPGRCTVRADICMPRLMYHKLSNDTRWQKKTPHVYENASCDKNKAWHASMTQHSDFFFKGFQSNVWRQLWATVCWSATVAASGDSRLGDCAGKTDVSEAAGSPALSFPWWETTRRLLLQLRSRSSSTREADLISVFYSYWAFQTKTNVGFSAGVQI